MRTIALPLLALALVFGAVTGLALESGEVAVLRTRPGDGSQRETRVWFVERDGAVYVESATPERAWYLDVRSDSEVELVRGDDARRYRAVPDPGAAGHARIRAMLREKYGWRDRWVALLQDTSASILVRLEPAATG